MYDRNITVKILTALSDTPVVLLNGARQTGKSTLVQLLVKNSSNRAEYYNLDNINTLAAANQDITAFINRNDGLMIVDEVQKIPTLFNAIKVAVDQDRKPGKFLLTGSANVLLLPKISESLAGRMEIISLWPFSQGEINGQQETFIDNLFAAKISLTNKTVVTRDEILELALRGGYPEILARPTSDRRQAWFASYTTALLERDIKELANIETATILPKLLQLLAARSATLLNLAEISRTSGIAHSSLTRYITLLQTTFLVHTINAWSNNIGKRLVKTPKIFLNDTGLMAYLLGIDKTRIDANPNFSGALLENFVVNELKKQLTWSKVMAQIFHYRTQGGHEVDILLENLAGECVGIEVKSSSTLAAKDFKGLSLLAENFGDRLICGIILYTGVEPLQFGKNLYALPLSSLWS